MTVHDNWLIGGYSSEILIDGAGITMWNGSTYRFGASIDNGHGLGGEFFWSVKDVGLFTTTRNLSYRNMLKSPDGIRDFTVVNTAMQSVSNEALGRCFIDCGRQVIDGTEKRLLIYVEYAIETSARFWYSAEACDADAGNTWTDLFGATCPAIRHFHGGIYVPNKGLYIFTGDLPPATQESILFCSEADIGKPAFNHGLITDPATWQARWGLTAGSRDLWAPNYHSAYVVGANDNKYRTVDMVTSDSKFGYWIPDSSPGVAGNSIWKLDMYDTTDSAGGTVTALKAGGVPGYGWYGCAGKNGIIYLSTLGYENTAGTGMEVGNDPCCLIYAIDSYTGDYALVKSIPRGDYLPQINRYPKAGVGFDFAKPLFEYGGEIWGELRFTNSPNSLTGVSYTHAVSVCGHVDRQQQTQENIITNGNFTLGSNGLTGWSICGHQLTFQNGESPIFIGDTVTGATSGATALVSFVTITSGCWAFGNAVGYIDLASSSGDFDFAGNEELNVGATVCATLKGGVTWEVIDDPTGGGGKVLKCRFKCTDITTGYYPPLIQWPSSSLTTAQKNQLYNNMETLSCWFYIKGDESDADLETRLFLYPKGGAGMVTNLTQASTQAGVPASTQKDVWHFMYVSDFVPYGATSFYHFIYPHYSKTDGKRGTIYFKDIQLVPGALPNHVIEQLNIDAPSSNFDGADIDNSGRVDMFDFAILAEHWLEGN
ncbi:MAG: hypothetical protein ABSE89_05575 [Sedimentisphaerales bacterium]